MQFTMFHDKHHTTYTFPISPAMMKRLKRFDLYASPDGKQFEGTPPIAKAAPIVTFYAMQGEFWPDKTGTLRVRHSLEKAACYYENDGTLYYAGDFGLQPEHPDEVASFVNRCLALMGNDATTRAAALQNKVTVAFGQYSQPKDGNSRTAWQQASGYQKPSAPPRKNKEHYNAL